MKEFKTGDLFKFVDTYDLFNIGHGSIGIVLATSKAHIIGFVGGRQVLLPFHHIVEVK